MIIRTDVDLTKKRLPSSSPTGKFREGLVWGTESESDNCNETKENEEWRLVQLKKGKKKEKIEKRDGGKKKEKKQKNVNKAYASTPGPVVANVSNKVKIMKNDENHDISSF